MEKQTSEQAQVPSAESWFKKNKWLAIIGGIVILIAVVACGWLLVRPRVYGTYDGYIDGKKEVKLVINKEGKDTKQGYLQYTSSSETGRAIRRFTKSLNKNETIINEFSEYLQDGDSATLKKMMRSDLYKNYLEKGKMPILVVKHDGDWYFQLDEEKYLDAGFEKKGLDDIRSGLFKKGKYSEDNKIHYGFHKLTVGPKDKNNLFYRANYKPSDPEDWEDKKNERKLANDFNELADDLDELSTMVDTMRNVAALGELSDMLDEMDDGDLDDYALEDGDDADSKAADKSSIDGDNAEDINYLPGFHQPRLVLE
ncbi:hypothetical protein [Limosilactobacillus caccae]|uniref:hypothetical protein n=1 Tax=Limosilactobacillus caccae TaxID=1926284 RepID=UPI000970FADC|nr:hypothetical protein [Limosilactobacillus caccae]